MPKRIFKFQGFYGGINDVFSPRDLSPTQLTTAQDIDISDLGQIKVMGAEAAHTIANAKGADKKSIQNWGLFFYSTDRTEAKAETGEDWILIADTGHVSNRIYKYGRVDGDISSYFIDLDEDGGGVTSFEPVFYVADGAVRVSDANFGTANKNKWHGYIKRTHFDGLTPGGSADAYNDWFTKDQDIAKPTRGIYGISIGGTATNDANSTISNLRSTDSTAFAELGTELNNVYIAVNLSDGEARMITARVDDDDLTTDNLSGTWQNDGYFIYPPAGTGFNLNVTASGSNGSGWTVGDYEFATSFIYDGNQESLLFENIGDGDSVNIAATGNNLNINVICTSPFNERITGGRVYYREFGSNDEWLLLIDINLKEGTRSNLDAEFLNS